ncbi:hypothetical protein H072_10603 [Dactylellina haptotyla CBS 200.50]|uniref:Uncharacterized protein n=1 Tax=Dactylellina haptotyla (strain CBS 200.50) TaxID=1284197 RepID=S7ZYW5_DACHA|nr:hypothetical protein H072_10603 [Dactylellina haptotyla CBS 200.50]
MAQTLTLSRTSSQQGGAPLNNLSQLPLLPPQSRRNPSYPQRAASLNSRNKELYGAAPVYVTGEDHSRRLANTTQNGAQYPASGFNALRHSQAQAAQRDAALAQDPSYSYGTIFNNAPEPGSVGRQLDAELPQHASTYVGQFPVPAQGPSTGNGTFPDQGSSSHLPSAANAPDSRPSSEFPGGNKRKLSTPSSQLPYSYKDLPTDHLWYPMFNYKEYTPQKNKKGKTGGTRSIDHVRGTEIKDRYATWSFQHDPIKYWLLRDVAEKFPTKVREKEFKHYQQYGSSETESQSVILEGEEEEEEEYEEEEGQSAEGVFDADGEVSVPASAGKRTKRRRISDESSVKLEESSVYDGESEKSASPKKKGRTNWDRSYQRRFPGEAIPSSTPLFRETVHTLIHAGKPDNAYGPRDINTCFIKALERCSDPNFHRYLLEKLKDLNGPSSPSTEYRPPSSIGRPASVRSRKPKSVASHYMEDIQESMETQMPRTYQQSNHSSHQTHGGIHQEASPSPDQTHHQIASGFPTGFGGGSDLFNQSGVPFSDPFLSQNGEIGMDLFPLFGVNEPQYPSSITDPLDEGEDNM